MTRKILLFFLIFLSAITSRAEDTTPTKGDSAIHLGEVTISDFRVNKHDLVPVARTRINRQELDARQVTSLKELSAVVPNFFMPDYAARTTAPIYIRGVGIKSDGTAAAFYIDGVPYYEPITFETDMSEIESVEVLRGPQGTLFGRNAIGGIINIQSLSPLTYQGTRIKIGGGNHNDQRIHGSIYRMLTPNFGLALGANYHHSGGYLRNAFNGHKTNKLNETEEHVAFYWLPAERWRIRLTSRLAYSDQGGYSYSPYDTEADTLAPVNYNRPSGFRRTVSTSGLSVRYAGDGFTINSQTSFQYLKSHQWVDQDYTAADKTFVINERHQNMVSQEFTAKSDNDGRYQWVTGVFGMYQHVDRNSVNQKPSALTYTVADYHQPTSSLAVYHQSSYNVWRGLSLSAGLRFDYEHTHSDYTRLSYDQRASTVDPSGDFHRSQDFHQLTPKVAVQYLTTQGQKFYATLTRGYKPGGFNRSTAKPENQRYNPEYSWNWEVGTQLAFFDKRLTLGGDLFYIDWRHMQLTYTYVGIGTITTNAGHADSRGFELNASYSPIKDLRFDAAYGYTYARFVSYHKAEGIDYSHNRLPMVPTNTLSLSANYSRDHVGWIDHLNANVGLTALGKIRWAEDNVVKQNFYALLNASLSLQKGIFTLGLWAKNITSTDYLANVMTVSTGTYAQKGKPFGFGATLSVDL